MYIQQSTSFPILLRLQAFVAALAEFTKPIVNPDVDTTIPGLDRHLQYDVGDIDWRPSTPAPDSYERRLWLHYYPR